MTGTFILFILLATGYANGGPAVSSQEFHSREACEYAAKEIQGRTPQDQGMRVYFIGCFSKGVYGK